MLCALQVIQDVEGSCVPSEMKWEGREMGLNFSPSSFFNFFFTSPAFDSLFLFAYVMLLLYWIAF